VGPPLTVSLTGCLPHAPCLLHGGRVANEMRCCVWAYYLLMQICA
jgi:hypothetical protein